ncbi:putative membrane protein YesL [Bacillus niacini]|uniref:Membrane protein YesL n=1 Tax=Neobacillus niacini TaxID=86668 RepID=A0A852TGK0_9BACI|nr:DUF624 domain-containing protein [Neobacillus niacini]NYE07933.1 putative membrane protein YesL [Neobacillus niacini]
MNTIFSKINPIFEWTTKLAGTNLLWVLFNLPVFYLTLLLYFAKDETQFIMLAITIAVLAPFIFFPATTALFGVIRKLMLKEEIDIIRFYWKYYIENYKRSITGGLVLTLFWSILVVDFYYFQTPSLLKYLFLFLLAWLFLFTQFFFASTVHTETKLLQSIKNSLILSIVNPFYSFGIVTINIVILYISINQSTFLLPFFSGSLIAFLSFSGYLKILGNVMELQKKSS